MGRPEELGEEAGSLPPTAAPADTIRPRKRLYRDPDDKILGGVCGGLGAYFDVDPVIFRLIFALLLFGAGTGVLLYLVLWIAVPKARTAAEKLEMRGERVDLQNITQAVKEELSGVKNKAQDLGKEAADVFSTRKKKDDSDLGDALREIFLAIFRVLGWVIRLLLIFVGILLIFILGVVLIALISSSAFILPFKMYIWPGFWPGSLFWPAIILVLGVPIVALMIYVIRNLTGAGRAHPALGYTLAILWVLGLVGCLWLACDIGHHFQVKRSVPQTFSLQQPRGNTLYVKWATVDDRHFSYGSIREWNVLLHHRVIVGRDSLFYPNVKVHIIPAPALDSFRIQVNRVASGATSEEAFAYARQLSISLWQEDSVLWIPEMVPIPAGTPFRYQHIEIEIFVPNDKQAFLMGSPGFDEPDWNDEAPDTDAAITHPSSSTPSQSAVSSSFSWKRWAPHWSHQADSVASTQWMDGLFYLFFSLFNIQPK
ncbi:MAG: PspC domain-containing protein [Thermoflavifilum sp.]|nr:PspC domain-containing protein [Thermoflavifilum sp.]